MSIHERCTRTGGKASFQYVLFLDGVSSETEDGDVQFPWTLRDLIEAFAGTLLEPLPDDVVRGVTEAASLLGRRPVWTLGATPGPAPAPKPTP